MAERYTRVSPGMYRDNQTKKLVRSATNPGRTQRPQAQAPAQQPQQTMQPPLAPTAPVTEEQLGRTASTFGTGLTGVIGRGFGFAEPEMQIRPTLEQTNQLAEEAFARFDREIGQREGRAREQLQSTLAARGINVNNPNDPTYRVFMDDLERQFGIERQRARDASFEQGLQAVNTLGGLQNQQVEGAFQRAFSGYGANLQGLGAISGLMQRPTQIALQRQQLNNQLLAASRSGQPQTPEVPQFNTTLPPGAATR